MGKGFFPYEYLTSYDMLDEPGLPPRSAFDSKLRSTKLADKDGSAFMWYNDLDVIPFMKAIKEQMKFFHGFGLDMFHDGVSLPGLAEKIMYQTCYEDENYIQPREIKPPEPFEFGKKRLESYRQQDKKTNRKFNLTMDHRAARKAELCVLAPLTKKTASADRINNFKGHINGNIIITCKSCNCARKDIPIHVFKQRKLLQHNANRLIYSIDEEQKEIYDLMKRNITGGPSIIFNRFAKAGFTVIRGGKKKCMKIIGYDANALYLWCLMNDMPCGRPVTIPLYDELIDDIFADKQFGFIEGDIETPEHLKAYFKEMTPIFKNGVIEPTGEVIGDFMADVGKKENKKAGRKLFGSYFGKQILIYSPLLKWYLAHGMVATKVHTFVKCHTARPFKKFGEKVSDARRAGDADKSKAVLAEAMKLVGNSPYGCAAMNKTKHRDVVYSSDDVDIRNKIEHYLFKDLEELQGGCEISNRKRNITLYNPIHMAVAVYLLAKLRMLEFYYDCIDFYFDCSDFEYCTRKWTQIADTLRLVRRTHFPDLVKPELREHFEAYKHEWFPRDDTPEHAAYDKRTPGLLKEEWRGNAMVSIASKTYICYEGDLIKKYFDEKAGDTVEVHHKTKCSAKGVQKSNNKDILTPEKFESVIKERVSLEATNRGFRIVKAIDFLDDLRISAQPKMQTYELTNVGCSFFYDKRIVLEDRISTIPLEI
ncbi:Hypothetical protein PHPALM_36980 [Phytophthora palmivora]|uniref:DNA-directed DNA polymerase n=1 Tax=Phytophthora palmivora TaxID=4796 RepID=A0A2P4WYJ1_9STRA|nr:Hypothetical protein PHPALM_36980 [Phytophthora palmivora]